MKRTWIRFTNLSLLGLALAIAGCEYTGGAERLTGPGGGPARTDGTATGVYQPVKVFCDKQSSRTASTVIRHNGGSIGVAGTVLIIPRNAVALPTLFVMEANNGGCKSKADMIVSFEAYQKDSNGDWTIPVGHLGFLLPLELRVNSDIAEKVDPSQLRVVWNKTDGSQEVYSTDVAPDGRYRTYLDHFSDYLLAMP